MSISKSIPIKTQHSVRDFLFLFGGILGTFFWILTVFRYHFDFKWPDVIPLALCLIVPLVLLKAIKLEIKIRPVVAGFLMAGILISLLPLTRVLLIRTEYAWFLCYLSLMVVSFLLEPIQRTQPIYSFLGFSVWLFPFEFDENQHLYFDKSVNSFI